MLPDGLNRLRDAKHRQTLYFDGFQITVLFVTVLLVRSFASKSPTISELTAASGQLSDWRWEIPLAGRLFANDDVYYHRHCRMVRGL
jgi:hypothetical protein